MRETWTFHSAGQLVFCSGAARQLGEKAGLLDRVRAPLAESGVFVEVFNGGEAEPSMRAAQACIEAGRRFRPDAVLGLGGGSNMDLAKITAAVLAHGGGPP